MTLIHATTIARVKTLAGITNADKDTELTAILASVSQRFEGFMGQRLAQESRTVEFSVQPRANAIFLRAFPVQSITSVKNDQRWDWASATAIDTDLYHLDGDSGTLYIDYDLQSGAKALQVVFVAGFGTDTADLILNYPAIAQAADLQVLDIYRRRNSPAGSSKSLGGNRTEFEGPIKMLPEVRETLAPFRVISFGL